MQIGQNFRLKTTTLGITSQGGHRISMPLPATSIVEMLSNPDQDHLIEVLWEGRRVLMFEVDIQERGLECD